MFRYQKNKYRAKRCRCNQNHVHHSRGEAAYCNDLALELKAGEFAVYETQVAFELHAVNGKKVAVHYVDFLVTGFDGKKEIREFKTKGTVTPVWKLKMALCEYEYPDIPYIVIWGK